MLSALLLTFTPQFQLGEAPEAIDEWGPYQPYQRVAYWGLSNATDTSIVFVYFRGGGFQNRAPDDRLHKRAEFPRFSRIELHETMRHVRDMGFVVCSAGAAGADREADPANSGMGVWRPFNHDDWNLPSSVTWYEKEAQFALDTIEARVGNCRFVAMGISAGSMQALWAGVDFAVCLNTPLSWKALIQDQAHVALSYLPNKTTGAPYRLLADVRLVDQVAASPGLFVRRPEAIFFGNDFPAALGLPDCDPYQGVSNLLPNIHDYAQSVWAFQAREDPDDELWCLQSNALGLETGTFSDPDGVRSRELHNAIRSWLSALLTG